MKRIYLLTLLILVFSPYESAHCKASITVIKAARAKYNASARLKITSPHVLKRTSPILALVSNFPIGVDNKSLSLDDLGVKRNAAGSRVLLVFSNGQRIYVTKDDVNLLITQRSYFNKRFRITVPKKIYNEIEGSNFILYSMLINCYGEAIKNENAFYTDVYCYNHEKKGAREVKKELKEPFVVYNEPYGKVDGGAILVDFYVRNAIISPAEHKVDLYIDGTKMLRFDRWVPYIIKGLPKGKHNIRLELIDPSGNIVNNPVSIKSSTIYVK